MSMNSCGLSKGNINCKGSIEDMETSFSDHSAKVKIRNLKLNSNTDKSKDFLMIFEKSPVNLKLGNIYASYAKFDGENNIMLKISEEISHYKNLGETEKLNKILEILRKYIKYPYKNNVEELKHVDKELALRIEKYLLTENSPIINLTDTFEKGYGICGSLSLAYLYLAEKMGFKGVILFGDEIMNIKRSDNGQSLFKMCNVWEKSPNHVRCEIQLSDGSWVPVDPSTQIIGDSIERLSDFKKANYLGREVGLPLNITTIPERKLQTLIPIRYFPGEKFGKAICSVKKSFTPSWKNFEPFNGDCEIDINLNDTEQVNLKSKISYVGIVPNEVLYANDIFDSLNNQNPKL